MSSKKSTELPAIGSVWGVPGDTSTWMQIRRTSEGVVGRRFNGAHESLHNFPPAGYVRIDNDDAANNTIRTDTAGRDVTNLPVLWSEDDATTKGGES